MLALSGVEAIANMTGIMVTPVEKTARKAIVPVLIEIVVLNLILAAAMNALPDKILFETGPDGTFVHTGDMLKMIAAYYVGPVFAAVSSVVFAALPLSATNTAIGALVSVQFMLARDKERPHALLKLNRFGMPKLPLIVAAIIPAVVPLIFPEVEKLADLYAIGVVGAIAINLASIATNPALTIRRAERTPLMASGPCHKDGSDPGSGSGGSVRRRRMRPHLRGRFGRPNSARRGTNWFQVRMVRQVVCWRIAIKARSWWTARTAMAPLSGLRPSRRVRASAIRNAGSAPGKSPPNRSTNRSRACRVNRTEL